MSLFVAITVTVVVHGPGRLSAALLVGVVFGTLLMLLVGFTTSLPFASVSDWFLAATIPLAVMNLPILHYSGLWPNPVLYLIPTQGPLLLFGVAFGQADLAPWQLGYAVAYPLLCIGALFWSARVLFDRYVIAKSGGM